MHANKRTNNLCGTAAQESIINHTIHNTRLHKHTNIATILARIVSKPERKKFDNRFFHSRFSFAKHTHTCKCDHTHTRTHARTYHSNEDRLFNNEKNPKHVLMY